MVILFFLFMPALLFGGDFTASVSNTNISLGESFTLNLTLKDASATGQPHVGALKQSFYISTQQQSMSTVINNGYRTLSTTWKYTLVPQKEGEFVIPALSIDTTQGSLTTKPIHLKVAKHAPQKNSEKEESSGLQLTSEVSNAKPYKNEPFTYTVKLISKFNLANISMEKLSIEDALVEPVSDPKVYETVMNGINVAIVEFNHLVTPLKAGVLKIPPAIIQGGIQTRTRLQPGSFFDDGFDPFSLLQGFDRLKPFSMLTQDVNVDVQPPIASVSPWLPAHSFRIEENWDETQPLKVGEPINLSFIITAEGIKSSQLPSLQDFLTKDPHFKVYADKPQLGDEIVVGTIKSFRKEQYTLIPQQSGTLRLPEIAISWWDVKAQEKVVTKVPSRKLQVEPAAMLPPSSSEARPESQSKEAPITTIDPLIYVILAILSVLLLVAITWVVLLQRKLSDLSKPAQVKKEVKEIEPAKPKDLPKKDKNDKLPDLNPT